MKENSFFAEALRAIVEYRCRKVKRDAPEYYTDQKNQLWYGLMNIVDAPEEKPAAEEKNAPEN